MTFTLGLSHQPSEMFHGMDRFSASVCQILSAELGFTTFQRATPHSLAWNATKPGVIATVRYAERGLTAEFERLTGVDAPLFVSLDPSKSMARDESIATIFLLAHEVLSRTTCDAGFVIDWEVGILRRVRGDVFIDDIPELVLQGDTDELLQLLDPTGSAHRRLRRRLRP